MLINDILLWICHDLFVYSSFSGYSGYYFFETVISTLVNIYAHIFVGPAFISLRHNTSAGCVPEQLPCSHSHQPYEGLTSLHPLLLCITAVEVLSHLLLAVIFLMPDG